jgi:hypothetical protein
VRQAVERSGADDGNAMQQVRSYPDIQRSVEIGSAVWLAGITGWLQLAGRCLVC